MWFHSIYTHIDAQVSVCKINDSKNVFSVPFDIVMDPIVAKCVNDCRMTCSVRHPAAVLQWPRGAPSPRPARCSVRVCDAFPGGVVVLQLV